MPSSYLTSTAPPASSSSCLSLSASSLSMPSLTGLGASSTSALASFRPRPVAARTTLMTWIFLSPAPVRTTSNALLPSSAPASPPPPAAAARRGDRGRGDAERLLERLDALGQLEHRDALQLVDPFLSVVAIVFLLVASAVSELRRSVRWLSSRPEASPAQASPRPRPLEPRRPAAPPRSRGLRLGAGASRQRGRLSLLEPRPASGASSASARRPRLGAAPPRPEPPPLRPEPPRPGLGAAGGSPAGISPDSLFSRTWPSAMASPPMRALRVRARPVSGEATIPTSCP